MQWTMRDSGVFVRIDPGEHLVESLRTVASECGFQGAAITSGVGMLDGVELGFFDVELDDYKRTTLSGIHDLSSVVGNIIRCEADYVPHVHVVFNDPSYATFSGHLIEATCHITIELFLSTALPNLQRVKLAGCPATRIVGA